jgi:hypothetical protein
MTNLDLIEKLKKFPQDLPIVFFCNEDVVDYTYTWNECYIEDIRECLYIEWEDRIYDSIESIMLYLEDTEDKDRVNKIIEHLSKQKVLRIDLNVT